MDTFEEEDTMKTEWESGVEREKKVGSGVIDTKRDVEGEGVRGGFGLVSVSCFLFVGWQFELTTSEDLGMRTAISRIQTSPRDAF